MEFVHGNNLNNIKIGIETIANIDKTSRYFMVIEATSHDELDARILYIKRLLDIEVEKDGIKYQIIWN